MTASTIRQVPFLDLQESTASIRGDIDNAIARVLDRGTYVLGPEVEAFEAAWAAYNEAAHCIGVGSGLAALELALQAVGVTAGSEVVVPSNTYIATWLAVSNVGAVPVPVEPDPSTCLIDPHRILAAIGPSTRAILPVNLYGQVCDMGAIMAIATDHGIPVVVDGAQAHGARWEPRSTQPDATAWSFYPSKNLGALGDGGAVTTNRPDVAESVREIRNYGSSAKNVHDRIGTNSRLDELQAAILGAKLPHLARWNQRRRSLAAQYLAGLDTTIVGLPVTPPMTEPVWHLFVVRSPHRRELVSRLSDRGIGTMVHYPVPPHRQGAYANTPLSSLHLPISEQLHGEVLSLPLHPGLDDADVDLVIEAVNTFSHRN